MRHVIPSNRNAMEITVAICRNHMRAIIKPLEKAKPGRRQGGKYITTLRLQGYIKIQQPKKSGHTKLHCPFDNLLQAQFQHRGVQFVSYP